MAAHSAAGRDWWLRTVLVLQAPRAVFVALRDDSDRSAGERSEPVLLVVWLAGMASVLSTPTAATLMDEQDYDALLVAIWTFLAGGLYGGFAYWLFGAFLHGGVRALGSLGSYRRSRHVLAFAAVPLALSLVLLPVKLALYGSDVFREGGADGGAGGSTFLVLALAFMVWTVGLLVLGVRAVHGWTWVRAVAAVALAAALPVLAFLALSSL
jgi:hypothetical protein